MALSQIGEYMQEVTEVQPIIQVILKYLQSENPMIRYAVCHSIG